MDEVQIGMGKAARRAFAFDDIAIVPSRRTRDPEDVDISWELDAFRFDLPLMASAMDSVVSPATAVEIARLGGLPVLDLEGLWTRHEDPEPLLEELASVDGDKGLDRLRELHREPVKRELVVERVRAIRDAGAVAAGSLRPKRVLELAPALLEADLDLLVVQGTVVSAEHVSRTVEPLNLKQFIREWEVPVVVGGCASYQAALHLMRSGAVAVLVGVGAGTACTADDVLGVGVPQATAIADAAGARMRHLDETGVYVHVIADGGMRRAADIAKAVACGADAVMLGSPLAAAREAPGRGWHWSTAAAHATLPRGTRRPSPPVGTLEEVLFGPAHDASGRLNLFGGLRTAMALCGYETVKEFQKAELRVR